MKTMNRREAVLGAGVAAGLASVGRADALPTGILPADESQPLLRAADVLRHIRISGSDEQAFEERLGRAPCPAAPLSEARSRPARLVEGQPVVTLGLDGQPIAQGLRFDCQPNRVNRFTVDGLALVARRFCYTVEQVQWVPDQGMPPYAEYCPRYEYVSGAAYPSAKWHQIVPLIDGQLYFTGCQAADVCASPHAGAVAFDVNARRYEGSAGYYRVTIWSWS